MSSKKRKELIKLKNCNIVFTNFFLFLTILMISVFRTITEKRHLPSLMGKTELAVRGYS